MNAEIISVGTEILLGQILDTNTKFLSEKLAELGIDVYYHTTVGDNMNRLLEAFKIASVRSDLVITTGGLGPTADDLTKEALAKFLGLPLEISEQEVAGLKQYFSERKLEWVESNRKQAAFLPGSNILANAAGTAPGMAYKDRGCAYIVLPGPPGEMRLMFDNCALPWIRENIVRPGIMPLFSYVVKFMGISESKLEDILKDLFENQTMPTLALLAGKGEIHLRLTARAKDEESFGSVIGPVLSEIKRRAGKFIFAEGSKTLMEIIAETLLQNNLTISTAESCTGGMLGAAFTGIPGSSGYYLGSVIAYSNEVKTKLLGIPTELIQTHGAVSEEVAAEMARRIRELTGSSIGIGITGIAGPGGGTPEKPVGLVHIALNTRAQKMLLSQNFRGNRENIRERSVKAAQHLLLRYLRESR